MLFINTICYYAPQTGLTTKNTDALYDCVISLGAATPKDGMLILHSVQWGINPPPPQKKTPPPAFLPSPPLKSANCPSPPFLGNSPLYIGFS